MSFEKYASEYKEVGKGSLAEAGDKVYRDCGEIIILDEHHAKIHNLYEPYGYDEDSYLRTRIAL